MELKKYSRLFVFWVGLFVIELCVLLAVLEYSGIFYVARGIYRTSIGYEEAQDKKNQIQLQRYGETFLNKKNNSAETPYDPFNIEHVHPFYLFSSAWRTNQINEANNSVVTIEEDGFRKSYENSGSKSGIVVGGSTAFGAGTSDFMTSTSILNYRQNKINFRSRAIQSWNSHQELVALVKTINLNDSMAIGITGANDFKNGWVVQCRDRELPLDAHQDFITLEKIVGDIRDLTPNVQFSSVIETYLPKTHRMVTIFKQRFLTDRSAIDTAFCTLTDDEINEIADVFLDNQSRINVISKAYGADFYVILQPNAFFHRIPSPLVEYSDEGTFVTYKTDGKIYTLQSTTFNPSFGTQYHPYFLDYSEKYFSYVRNSEFCKKHCIDALDVFDDENESLDYYMYDHLHLTDMGTELFVEYILDNINLPN